MVSVDPKQSYYSARDLRVALEAKRNEYASQYGGTDVFSQAKFDKYGDALKAAQKSEFFSECDFSNNNAKVFSECCSKMRNPFAS